MSNCNCIRLMAKRAAAMDIKNMSAEEKKGVYRARFNAKHPGRMAESRREWYQRNKDEVCAKNKQAYREQKAGGMTYYQRNTDKVKTQGQTYYQRNKERIKARQRERYAETKNAG